MTINVALIDKNKETEAHVLSYFSSISRPCSTKLSLKTFKTSDDFHQIFPDYKPDLILLEIDHSNMEGCELSKTIKRILPDAYIVYLISDNHYIEETYEDYIFNYIMKETMQTDLPIVLGEVLKELCSLKYSKISLRTEYGFRDIICDDIVLIQYENRKPVIYFENQAISVTGHSLKSIYMRLDPTQFIRPNSSTIINMKYVKSICKNNIHLLNNDHLISVSRGRYTDIREHYITYCLQVTNHEL